jgi:hypothetical protein
MRAALLALLLLSLAACGTGGLPPLPLDRISARFPPPGLASTGPVNVILVDALTRLPLHRAELVAPDGHATPASAIDVNPSPGFTAYQAAAAHPYGGEFAGIGPRQQLLPTPAGAAPQSESRLLEMHSTAAITVPDPVAYGHDWRRYRIRLTFGTPPAPLESITIAAPAPPPG